MAGDEEVAVVVVGSAVVGCGSVGKLLDVRRRCSARMPAKTSFWRSEKARTDWTACLPSRATITVGQVVLFLRCCRAGRLF